MKTLVGVHLQAEISTSNEHHLSVISIPVTQGPKVCETTTMQLPTKCYCAKQGTNPDCGVIFGGRNVSGLSLAEPICLVFYIFASFSDETTMRVIFETAITTNKPLLNEEADRQWGFELASLGESIPMLTV